MIQFLTSITYIAAGVLFALLGLAMSLAPWSAYVRTLIIALVENQALALSLIGFTLIAIGVGMILSVCAGLRRRYIHLTVARQPVTVDLRLFTSYLTAYWRRLFPQNEITSYVAARGKTIAIEAELPYVPFVEQEALIAQIKEELAEIFAKFIGYTESFHLALHFRAPMRHLESPKHPPYKSS